MEKKKVVIIGGGITGLSAAYYLQKEIKENGLPLEVKLFEASDRLGGIINTVKKDGFIVEKGPDSVLARKTSALKLIKEVGLEDKVVSNTAGKSYIYARGKLHTMPEGAFMGIPTQITPFALSGLFSPFGKLRAAGDFILPKGKEMDDQSLGQFFRRRLGNEIVDNLIDPLLSGIYAGDIDHLSLMSLFPMFYDMEQKHRSLVLGLKKSMPKPPKSAKKASKKGMFISLSTGLQSLIEELEKRLDEGTVVKQSPIEKIVKAEAQYTITLANGSEEQADSIIIATEHYHAQKMLSNYTFMKEFDDMISYSVANVAMAFPKSAIKQDIDGTGFLVSRNSDFRITACTWTHKKWPSTTPDDMALLRCYVGKPNDQDIVDLSDEEIINIALRDLNKTMNITQKPLFHMVTRWKDSMPQYNVGHIERMKNVKESLAKELPGVYLAGGSYEGVGIPDCINQGEAAVKKVLEHLA
ncbi:protoporphyrinogen oxidase [Anaerobacillus arseniciselenatis]|uniref:Coproporphyrinogen III oxidase n=1 Tax=Anaerobacillus arseniciselenatis TaxID=85682 RepID=A0A1S2LQE5_9BACI|nr:protoporphyrinogen oxidase [Anaerobacillus arseniciselenatis]OIJ14554.1 protoporphyrinogen oxidase [Anaerobacillus arseniciselenatis]